MPKQSVCPFCKGAISSDLERYGGSCPHCLLEIPGDDAPTDPGLAARQKQQEEEEKAAIERSKRNRLVMLAASFVVLLLVGGGVYQYLSWQEKIAYEAQEYFQLPLEDLTQPEAQVASATPPDNGAKPPVGVNVGKPGDLDKSEGTPRPQDNGVTPPTNATPKPVGTPRPDAVASATPTTSGPNLSGISTGGTTMSLNAGDVLTDDDQIKAMVAYVTKTYGSQVRACYEQRAKQIPDLKGVWSVSFTIKPDGTTTGVRVAPAGGSSDPELEACIQRNAATWKFQKMTKEFKVTRSYRLGPSGW